jgi:transglutaminase-like putative cysteine protease
MVRPSETSAAPLSDAERQLNTSATALLPVDGIVRETAEGIVRGKTTDIAKARALYDWMVENTFRDPKTRGCGVGDVSWMLKTGNLSGKCADLNALYVAMARSVGLPARDVYGIRVAPSAFGFKALGAGSVNVTKAQHCRAEVWLADSGWTPVDPADVRKVVLEEPPANLSMTDLKVMAARRTLFGAWEGNWLAFNTAHDVQLPASSEPPLPFLMYPQAADKQGLIDPLDPEAFKYLITAREVTA